MEGSFLLEVGVKATLRLMNHEGASEQWIKDNSTGKMGYIWCVGVLADQRGRGHSRTLIDASIDRFFPVLERYGETIESVEDAIIS